MRHKIICIISKSHVELIMCHDKFSENENEAVEVYTETLPPHIFSVQVNSRSMLHHGSAWASLNQNKRNLKKPNPNPNPSRSIAFYCFS